MPVRLALVPLTAAALGAFAAPPAAATRCYVTYAVGVDTPAGSVTASGWSDEGVENGTRGGHTGVVRVLTLPPFDVKVGSYGGSPGIIERATGVSYRRLLCP